MILNSTFEKFGNFSVCVVYVSSAKSRQAIHGRYIVGVSWEGGGGGGYVHVIINVFGVSFICVTCIIVRLSC